MSRVGDMVSSESAAMPKEDNSPVGPMDLMVEDRRATELTNASMHWESWDLTPKQLCDVELLLCGAFYPLNGFMNRQEWESVRSTMRLPTGSLFPIPVTLDITTEAAEKLKAGTPLALRDPEGVMLAVLHVDEVWEADRTAEAEQVFGTTDTDHSGVHMLLNRSNPWYVGGKLEGIAAPNHVDFHKLRLTPAQVRERLGGQPTIAFQTRNPMHRAHKELISLAAQDVGAGVLIHPVVGTTQAGDIDYYTRVRCYEAILPHFEEKVNLALLPLAMRMAGPREALWHALIRHNYGCTHMIIGRDHAGPPRRGDRTPFYKPYAAQDLLQKHQGEMGIKMLPFQELVYVEQTKSYTFTTDLPKEVEPLSLSGSEVRWRLRTGKPIPDWFSYPEVIAELKKVYYPPGEQGFTVFFTGLSGSGKSTIAQGLVQRLKEIHSRPVTLLDGDVVRRILSSDLGFSREDRDLNIRRIGFACWLVTSNHGAAVAAPVAPFAQVRDEMREKISEIGGFILVHISTPIETCEARDRKGLYAKARAGLIPQFTGISDPYEEPSNADLTIDTTDKTTEECIEMIMDVLKSQGFLPETVAGHA